MNQSTKIEIVVIIGRIKISNFTVGSQPGKKKCYLTSYYHYLVILITHNLIVLTATKMVGMTKKDSVKRKVNIRTYTPYIQWSPTLSHIP